MRVGVPKEIKVHEYRVGLTPASVAELISAGHEVFVETRAGESLAQRIERAGADVAEHHAERKQGQARHAGLRVGVPGGSVRGLARGGSFIGHRSGSEETSDGPFFRRPDPAKAVRGVALGPGLRNRRQSKSVPL